jgi:Ser/Thr protein kinase RdoA (MazF antagonist)
VEKAIRDRYNDDILHQAMQRYDIADGHIHLLDGFESYMYAFDKNSASYILRIGHSIRRTPELIHGEVDWLNHLAAGGATVARAAQSVEGRLVEAIDDGQGGQFLTTAFVKAPGGPVWQTTGWSDVLYETYGKLIGRMHALSKRYELSNPAWKRPEWDDPVNIDVVQWLPDTDTRAAKQFSRVFEHLEALPKDPDSYGLIHQDAHAGNFFVDESGTITLFDFDDCVYSWFIYDIAMVVFYMVAGTDDGPAITQAFLPHFLRGYRSENRLDPAWLDEIPHFLKLREIDLYAVLHRSFDDPENEGDTWIARNMRNSKHNIANDLPFIDFDFGSMAGYV